MCASPAFYINFNIKESRMERKNTTKIDSCFKPIVSSSNIAENANAPEEIAAKVISDEIIDMFDVGKQLMRSILRASPCQESIWQVTRATSTSHT